MSQQQAEASTALSLTFLHIRIYVVAGKFSKYEVCTNIHIVDEAFPARGASLRMQKNQSRCLIIVLFTSYLKTIE